VPAGTQKTPIVQGAMTSAPMWTGSPIMGAGRITAEMAHAYVLFEAVGEANTASEGATNKVIIDSGASGHFCVKGTKLSNVRKTRREIASAGSQTLTGKAVGDWGCLVDAVEVDGLTKGLASVGKLSDHYDVKVIFTPEGVYAEPLTTADRHRTEGRIGNRNGFGLYVGDVTKMADVLNRFGKGRAAVAFNDEIENPKDWDAYKEHKQRPWRNFREKYFSGETHHTHEAQGHVYMMRSNRYRSREDDKDKRAWMKHKEKRTLGSSKIKYTGGDMHEYLWELERHFKDYMPFGWQILTDEIVSPQRRSGSELAGSPVAGRRSAPGIESSSPHHRGRKTTRSIGGDASQADGTAGDGDAAEAASIKDAIAAGLQEYWKANMGDGEESAGSGPRRSPRLSSADGSAEKAGESGGDGNSDESKQQAAVEARQQAIEQIMRDMLTDQHFLQDIGDRVQQARGGTTVAAEAEPEQEGESSEDEYDDPVKYGKLAHAVLRYGVRSLAVWNKYKLKTRIQLYKEGQRGLYNFIAESLTMRYKSIIARATDGDGKAAWKELKAKFNNLSAGSKATFLTKFTNASMQQQSYEGGRRVEFQDYWDYLRDIETQYGAANGGKGFDDELWKTKLLDGLDERYNRVTESLREEDARAEQHGEPPLTKQEVFDRIVRHERRKANRRNQQNMMRKVPLGKARKGNHYSTKFAPASKNQAMFAGRRRRRRSHAYAAHRQGNGNAGRKCFSCGEPGHFARECPHAAKMRAELQKQKPATANKTSVGFVAKEAWKIDMETQRDAWKEIAMAARGEY